jgi:hypothetical protein
VKLAVYRAGEGAEKHLARLRRTGRFTLACFSARRTLTTLSQTAYDGVLWELAPGHQPDRRHIAAMARRMPILSYSAARGRDVIELSRRLGFTTHLRAPLSPADLDGHLARANRGEGVRVDLFTRIRQTQRALRAQRWVARRCST